MVETRRAFVFAIRCHIDNYLRMATTNKLIGSAEACRILHVSRPTLTRMVQAGDIKVAVEGEGIRGPRFFYRSEVERVARKRAAA